MRDQGSLRRLHVWRCTQLDICGVQWASEPEEPTCPFCHLPGEQTEFTYGEVADACERFGCEIPVHMAHPIPEVVQLSTLPRELWEGMPVFHPLAQHGDKASWHAYDVGVVVEVRPDADAPGFRCRFLHSIGGESGTLVYRPDNLWVPKVLADRLRTGL